MIPLRTLIRGCSASWLCAAIVALLLLAPASARADAGLTADRTYVGVNRAIPVSLHGPAGARGGLALIDPTTGETIATDETLRIGSSGAAATDLAERFPLLWTRRRPAPVLVQGLVEGDPVGPPLVLRPMIEPARAIDGLTADVMDAFARSDALELTRLLQLSSAEREALRGRVRRVEPAWTGSSGYRLARLRTVTLATTAGPIVIELAPWAAPLTCDRFIELADGGFYDGVAFHRVIAADEQGWPFIIQAGDPTGAGAGGSGALLDFEWSELPHDKGVVSMARRRDDPNSSSSQFVICLSREACATLDGASVSFGRVVDGMDAVRTIADGPTENDSHRPLRPVVIERARSAPAPPRALAPSSARSSASQDDEASR